MKFVMNCENISLMYNRWNMGGEKMVNKKSKKNKYNSRKKPVRRKRKVENIAKMI